MDRDDSTGPNEPGQLGDDQFSNQQWPQKPTWPVRPANSVNANLHKVRQNSQADVDRTTPALESELDQTAPYKTVPRNPEISEEPPIARTAPYKPIRQVKVTRKRSNLSLILGILALILLVAAAVAAYWAWNNLLNRPSVPASRLLPMDTLAYVTIDLSPDGDQKVAFNKLRSIFESDPTFKDAWANVVKTADDLTREVSQQAQGDCKNMLSLDQVSGYLAGSVTIAVLPPRASDL